MNGTIFHLFVILLGLSHLLCFKAVPITRTESLMQSPKVHLEAENVHNQKVKINGRNWHREEATVTERMDLELNDYQPPGANGRHTPRGP